MNCTCEPRVHKTESERRSPPFLAFFEFLKAMAASSILRASPLLSSRLFRPPHLRLTSRHFEGSSVPDSSPLLPLSTSLSSFLFYFFSYFFARNPSQIPPPVGPKNGPLRRARLRRRRTPRPTVRLSRVPPRPWRTHLSQSQGPSGLVQITTLPEANAAANKVILEYVVAVEGTVRASPGESLNKKMKTGNIEVAAEHVVVLHSVNRALPFPVTISNDVKEIITEEIRLRYRFLDLRRPQMQSNLRLRHKVVKLIRRYLEDIHDFIEIETRMLSKSTPNSRRCSGLSCTFTCSALKKGDIYAEAIKAGAEGLPFLKVLDDGDVDGVPALVSSLRPEGKEQLLRLCSAKAGDLILFAAGHHTVVNKILDRVGLFTAHQLGMIDQTKHSILWVTDFPMFEWNGTEQRFEALHHPFTAPNPDDIDDLTSARALAYDIVFNNITCHKKTF